MHASLIAGQPSLVGGRHPGGARHLPQLTAPDDLRALALPMWQALLPDWDVEIVRTPALGSRGLTGAVGALRKALVQIGPHGPADNEEETLAHELAGHVLFWPATELLDHSDPRTVALIEPMAERLGVYIASGSPSARVIAGLARAAAELPARLGARTKTPAASLAREGDCMDLPIIIAALSAIASAADVGAALGEFVTQLQALVPADAAAPAPEDMAGAPVEMMRRALARKAPAPAADTLGPKVLARLGVKSDAAALMTLDGVLAQAAAGSELAREADVRARKDEIGAAIRAGAKRFGLDDKGNLLPSYLEGTLEDVKSACAKIREALPGVALTRPRIEPVIANDGDAEISPAVRRYAEKRGKGGDVEYMKRIAANMPNSGALPQES